MAKFCPNCGKEIKEGENFCSNCGPGNTAGSIVNTTEEQKTNGLAIGGLVCAILGINVVGLILSILGLKYAKENNNCQKGIAVAGTIISAIRLAITIIILIIYIILFVFAASSNTVSSEWEDITPATYDNSYSSVYNG